MECHGLGDDGIECEVAEIVSAFGVECPVEDVGDADEDDV